MLGELVAAPGPGEEAALVLVGLELDQVGARELGRGRTSRGEHDLPARERLGEPLRRDRLHPAQPHQAEERLAVEPVLAGLAREVPLEQRQLPLDDRLR